MRAFLGVAAPFCFAGSTCTAFRLSSVGHRGVRPPFGCRSLQIQTQEQIDLVRRSKVWTPSIRACKYSKVHSQLVNSAFSSSIANAGDGGSGVASSKDELIQMTSTVLNRTSWFSWWAQVILSVVSAVTLIFAKSVMNAGAPSTGLAGQGGNFVLAGTGIVLSAVSIFWTWGLARLARRLVNKEATSRITAANLMRRAVVIGTTVNLLGMFITLVGAEQIVGLLAAKVLTMQGVSPFGSGGVAAAAVATQTLQPLDILIVQGNTNTLFSHFISLCCTLYLTRWIDRLDPPSKEEKPRKR